MNYEAKLLKEIKDGAIKEIYVSFETDDGEPVITEVYFELANGKIIGFDSNADYDRCGDFNYYYLDIEEEDKVHTDQYCLTLDDFIKKAFGGEKK